MKNKVINVIRLIENGAEKEYLKEFFRFIGCFLTDWTVDIDMGDTWERWLRPVNEQGSVEILINFFGEDPYRLDCQLLGIDRIYCYFSVDDRKMYGKVTDQPLESELMLPQQDNKALLRSNVLGDLIKRIWRNEPAALKSVLAVYDAYIGNSQGDLFYYLQAKRALRFLSMSDVLNEPDARVSHIQYVPYIGEMIEAMWELYVKLEGDTAPYSRYAQLKAVSAMRETVSRLDPMDQQDLERIAYENTPLNIPSLTQVVAKSREIINDDPHFLTAYLYLASQHRKMQDDVQSEEDCYLQVLRQIPNERPEYAFLYYRIGYYFEKKHRNEKKALEYYQEAIMADPQYYQALFKLGHFAAKDGRFKEAETMLHRTIQAIFHGRSTDPDENGMYSASGLSLSMKESQYAFKAYILLAKIAINSNREYSAKAYVGRACMAAIWFDEAELVWRLSCPSESERFFEYHNMSDPVRAIWKVLKPWGNGIVQDNYIRSVIQTQLRRWK